ncbi:MAG TPA: lysophospholipid acyltransferase family protein [Dissulfurispiraceae bacterium]|nr:lysophospholipid acyltransferase family protein [Dissulfurispiraceae bacterium]
MTVLRAYRLLLLLAVSLFFLAAGVVVNLAAAASEGGRARACAICTMMWARAMCLILGIRVRKGGAQSELGGFVVCNHSSYLDILVMGSVRPSSFLAKKEVRGWPLVGWLAILGGTLFINREHKKSAIGAMGAIGRKIDHGVMVVIFPEGTTSDGKSIRMFKSTFFSVPARRNIPVTPVSIRYPSELIGTVAWYGGKKLMPHLWHLLGIRRIEASLYFNPPVSRPVADISAVDARKQLCAQAYESVVQGFGAAG